MQKTSEYRKHAAECRNLAGGMSSDDHREQLLAMAATWERMAEEGERMLRTGAQADLEPEGGGPGETAGGPAGTPAPPKA